MNVHIKNAYEGNNNNNLTRIEITTLLHTFFLVKQFQRKLFKASVFSSITTSPDKKY